MNNETARPNRVNRRGGVNFFEVMAGVSFTGASSTNAAPSAPAAPAPAAAPAVHSWQAVNMRHEKAKDDPTKPTIRKLRVSGLPVKNAPYHVQIKLPCVGPRQHSTKLKMLAGKSKCILIWDDKIGRLDLSKLDTAHEAASVPARLSESTAAAPAQSFERTYTRRGGRDAARDSCTLDGGCIQGRGGARDGGGVFGGGGGARGGGGGGASEGGVCGVWGGGGASGGGGGGEGGGAGGGGAGGTGGCSKCGQPGHFARDCPNPPSKEPTTTSPRGTEVSTLTAASPSAAAGGVAGACKDYAINLDSDSSGGGAPVVGVTAAGGCARRRSAGGLCGKELLVVRSSTERLEQLIGFVEPGTVSHRDQILRNLSNGARVWGYTPGTETAMHRAVRRASVELMRLLLDNGVDCSPPPAAGTEHSRNGSGKTAMLLIPMLVGEIKLDSGGHLSQDDAFAMAKILLERSPDPRAEIISPDRKVAPFLT